MKNAGYESIAYYQYGVSKYNYFLFGWAGHTNDGKKVYDDALVLWDKMVLWQNLSKIIKTFNTYVKGKMKTLEEKEIDSMVQTSTYIAGKFCYNLKPNISIVPFIYFTFNQQL